MKLTNMSLRIGLPLAVALLCLFSIAGIALGWYGQKQAGLALASVPAVTANIDGFNSYEAWAPYLLAVLLALTVVVGLFLFAVVTQGVLRPVRELDQRLAQIAAGDFRQRITPLAENEIGALANSVNRLQDSVARAIQGVRVGMESVQAGARQIVSGNSELGARTQQQTVVLQETTASMEQLASTVRQNADNALQANQLAVAASEVASLGGRATGEVVATMEGISQSSRKIADIVGVIDSIAFQTNILALNAAVEAARAGEQGKGFAVVATEVRALAQRSAQAAKEIKQLIEDSVRKVVEGSVQVEHAGSTMQQIVTSVARVTDIMGEISAATAEQSAGIDQINKAVAQLEDVTQQNAVLVVDATQSVTDLNGQLADVVDVVAGFRVAAHQIIDVPACELNHSKHEDKRLARADSLREQTTREPRLCEPSVPARTRRPKAACDTDMRHAPPALNQHANKAGQRRRPRANADEPGRSSFVMKTQEASARRPAAEQEWAEF